MVITCDISRTHCQLRRLKNEGCALQEQTIVTAIPVHKSRAMFECIKIPEEPTKDGNTLGYIMFECGLEGIRTKMVKRSQFEKSENNEDNIKTVVETTTKREAQPNDPKTVVSFEDVAGAKPIEPSTTRLSLRKPLTPKTPRDKIQSAIDTKAKESKEATNPKDKSKFTFKSSESVHVTIPDETVTNKPAPQASTSASAGPSSAAPSANNKNEVAAIANNNGRTSSCVIDLKSVWFNFAAPPSVPITRKIDYTRLDWNLLSTASPAITAWMNPSNRFAIKLVAMMKAFHLRRTAVAASLMADALEVQGIQKHPKTRYSGKFTPMAKTLLEDPSCQLCTVMQKFVLQQTAAKIDEILKHPELPPLNTLRQVSSDLWQILNFEMKNVFFFLQCGQGVIALSRQWKNMLYNPMLFEHQYKNKLSRPMNVTFAVSQAEEVNIRFFCVPEFAKHFFPRQNSQDRSTHSISNISFLSNRNFCVNVFSLSNFENIAFQRQRLRVFLLSLYYYYLFYFHFYLFLQKIFIPVLEKSKTTIKNLTSFSTPSYRNRTMIQVYLVSFALPAATTSHYVTVCLSSSRLDSLGMCRCTNCQFA